MTTDDQGFDEALFADIKAEQSLLGACMTSGPLTLELAEMLAGPDDFYRPAHRVILRHLVVLAGAGRSTDPISLRNSLEESKVPPRTYGGVDGPLYLFQLAETFLVGASAADHAAIIAKHAERRRSEEAGTRFLQSIRNPGTTTSEAVERLTADLERIGRPASQAIAPPELDDFLSEQDDETYDWIIPGLIERHDRLILTGPEGGGKSTLLRQLAIQAASGLHPVTGELFDPATVLFVDLENSPAQTRRRLRPLRLAAGDLYQRGRFHLAIRPEGIDLTGPADREWLAGMARTIKPGLIVIGPLYKAANGDPTEEKSAKPVAVALDAIRMEIGAALLIEAHAPKTMHGTKRAIEPYGWSGWLRWPEFGLHLSAEGEIKHWRGQRDAREWPAMLKRGGAWPWSPVTRPRDLLWAKIADHCTEAGDQLTFRDLAEMTGSSTGAVQKAINENRASWDSLQAPK